MSESGTSAASEESTPRAASVATLPHTSSSRKRSTPASLSTSATSISSSAGSSGRRTPSSSGSSGRRTPTSSVPVIPPDVLELQRLYPHEGQFLIALNALRVKRIRKRKLEREREQQRKNALKELQEKREAAAAIVATEAAHARIMECYPKDRFLIAKDCVASEEVHCSVKATVHLGLAGTPSKDVQVQGMVIGVGPGNEPSGTGSGKIAIICLTIEGEEVVGVIDAKYLPNTIVEHCAKPVVPSSSHAFNQVGDTFRVWRDGKIANFIPADAPLGPLVCDDTMLLSLRRHRACFFPSQRRYCVCGCNFSDGILLDPIAICVCRIVCVGGQLLLKRESCRQDKRLVVDIVRVACAAKRSLSYYTTFNARDEATHYLEASTHCAPTQREIYLQKVLGGPVNTLKDGNVLPCMVQRHNPLLCSSNFCSCDIREHELDKLPKEIKRNLFKRKGPRDGHNSHKKFLRPARRKHKHNKL